MNDTVTTTQTTVITETDPKAPKVETVPQRVKRMVAESHAKRDQRVVEDQARVEKAFKPRQTPASTEAAAAIATATGPGPSVGPEPGARTEAAPVVAATPTPAPAPATAATKASGKAAADPAA